MAHKPIKITINLDTVLNGKSLSSAQQKGLTSGPNLKGNNLDSASSLQKFDSNDITTNTEDDSDSHTSIVTRTL